jgi:hypothetical protein
VTRTFRATRISKEHAVLDLNGQLITRQHVLRLLPLMDLSPDAEARLLALPYPVDFSMASAALESVGIDMDVLFDRMGGSP